MHDTSKISSTSTDKDADTEMDAYKATDTDTGIDEYLKFHLPFGIKSSTP